MDKIKDGLFTLLIKLQVIPPDTNEYSVVIFAIGCAIVGFLGVLSDLCFFKIKGESLLGFKYKSNSDIFKQMVWWSAGACLIGYIGQVGAIFQVSILACATIGLGWPLVLSRSLQSLRDKKNIQQATEEE